MMAKLCVEYCFGMISAVFVFVLFCFDYCIIDADELTFQKHAVFVTPRLSSIQFQSFVGVKIILPFSTKRA